MIRSFFSIFVYLYFSFLFLIFFVIISLVFLVTFPFDKYRKAPNYTLSIMARFMMKASPWWNIDIRGQEKFDDTQPTIFVCNHQSFLDMAVIYHLPWKMKWVSKRSLTYIPVMGWLVWLTGHLTINRSSKTAIKKLDNLIEPLKDLVPVMIFPEGTRTMDGKLKSFKNGAFLLCKEHNFKLQPMVINGGFDAMPSNSSKLNPRVNFKLQVMDPINPEEFEDMRELKDHTLLLMKEQLKKLKHT